MKKALICGVSGQDGAYLARSLLAKGYDVYGTSRDAQMSPFDNLVRLGIRESVKVLSVTLVDFRSVLQTLIRVEPDEVYNLAGQTSVALSFELPVETLESISVGTLNLLEAIRFSGLACRLYNASSSECFGDTGSEAAHEHTPFRPASPYAVAKAAAHWEVATYRSAYGLYACSGILFNHESPLRPERFVTRKIVAAACRIANGSKERLELGNTTVYRDWGWAPEYVEAMWLMLQQERADDYVIATGHRHALREFVEVAFEMVGCDPRTHVSEQPQLYRPSDITSNYGNPAKARERLQWSAQHNMPAVVQMMVEGELEHQARARAGHPVAGP